MLNDLPSELLYEIFYFLPNQDIIENLFINKKIFNLTQKNIFIDNILYRNHPMVFNSFGNFCLKCNLNLFILNETEEILEINCSHN